MAAFKDLTDYLVNMGIEKVPHSQKNYLAHLIAVYRLMESQGCTPEVCRGGMFHSIYGTELFQGFKLDLDQRGEVRDLIGSRAEQLGYWNCAMDRAFFDKAAAQESGPYLFRDRITGAVTELNQADFDDLCRIHLYDWLEQVPRSRHGWNYRRAAYRRLAQRLGVEAAYQQVFEQEPK